MGDLMHLLDTIDIEVNNKGNADTMRKYFGE